MDQENQGSVWNSIFGGNVSPETLAALMLMPRFNTKAGESGTYDIMDNGKKLGWTQLEYNPEKKAVLVDMIASHQPSTRPVGTPGNYIQDRENTLGTAKVREMINALRGTFPEVQTVGGFRVSGARDKAGKPAAVEMKIPPAPQAAVPSAPQPNFTNAPGRNTPPGMGITNLW